jgi:hypothetical protein
MLGKAELQSMLSLTAITVYYTIPLHLIHMGNAAATSVGDWKPLDARLCLALVEVQDVRWRNETAQCTPQPTSVTLYKH